MRFGLDGTEYEIDLSAKNAEALRKALARYVERRTPGTWLCCPAARPKRAQGECQRTQHHRRFVSGPSRRASRSKTADGYRPSWSSSSRRRRGNRGNGFGMAGSWFENLEFAQVRNGLRAWDRPGDLPSLDQPQPHAASVLLHPHAGVAVSCGHHPEHQACSYGNMSRSAYYLTIGYETRRP